MSQDLPRDDREFVQQAKEVLDRAVGEVDHAAVLRLQQGRLAALDARARRFSWRPWASGLAIASLAALAVLLWMQPAPPLQQAAVPLDDFELVTSVENVELAEDLEFFHWLAGDDQAG
ncbi:MAG: hypothetical protein LZF86_50110 [Nitrospira sp.]|nr:MAG: hypothetical protein LZF86_50110 [Nitrospira sp.]